MARKEKQQPAKLVQQGKEFVRVARELGCDENEEAFKELLRKLVTAPHPKPVGKPKDKKLNKLP